MIFIVYIELIDGSHFFCCQLEVKDIDILFEASWLVLLEDWHYVTLLDMPTKYDLTKRLVVLLAELF